MTNHGSALIRHHPVDAVQLQSWSAPESLLKLLVCVKLLPCVELSNLVFGCCLSMLASGALTGAAREAAARPCARVVPSHAMAVICPLFLPGMPGLLGVTGGFDLVELAGSTVNRTQIPCLSLPGSICYCSAAALFILPHAR